LFDWKRSPSLACPGDCRTGCVARFRAAFMAVGVAVGCVFPAGHGRNIGIGSRQLNNSHVSVEGEMAYFGNRCPFETGRPAHQRDQHRRLLTEAFLGHG
jgi:hypothetical protein